VSGKRKKDSAAFGAGFSNLTDIRMTENAFLLGNLQPRLYWFDTEGVKKTKNARSALGREN
jgi:hypothetical protein